MGILLKYLTEERNSVSVFQAKMLLQTSRLVVAISLATIFLLSVVNLQGVKATGTLEFGVSCDPTPSQTDKSKICDSSKRLSCDVKSLLCRCHHEVRDVYDEESGRCETKVGKLCASDNVFPVICVSNAVCNKTTNFCECQDGFEMNSDGSECSGGIHGTESSNIFMSSMGLFLLMISVFICT
jgi:hypothetical protein